MSGKVIIVRHHFRLFDTSSWLSLIIRLATKSKWNHCAITIDIEGVEYVAEARASGVYVSTWGNWLKHRPHKDYIIGRVKYRFSTPIDMEERIASRFGTPYDNIGLIFWHPFRLIFGKWGGGRSKDGKVVCSEYIGLCWIEFFPDNWMELTTQDIIDSGKFIF